MLSTSALIPYRSAAWTTIQRSLSTTRPFVGKDNNKEKNGANVKSGSFQKRRTTWRQQQERPMPHVAKPGENVETTPSKIYSQFKQPSSPRTSQQDKEKHQTNKNRTTSSSSKRAKAKQQQQDAFVTPGAPVMTPLDYDHNNAGLSSGSGTFRMTRILSTLNASALFRNGGKHRNRNSRECLLTVLREQVLLRRHRNAYALTGHGVPVQVLQDHINMADALLAREEHAAECSFNNFHGDLDFDWMRVRGRDGTNRASPWPNSASSESLTSSMELYLTVMNRLATTLGMVLTTGEDDTDEHQATKARSISHWNVDILRGLAYPPQLLPSATAAGRANNGNMKSQQRRLAPIIEWMPRNGVSAPGHVCIRVQGFMSAPDSKLELPGSHRRKKRLPVTLVFDACFRNTSKVE